MKSILRLVVICLICSSAAFGQTVGATIQGAVNDSSGAVLPGVQIVVKNTATGSTHETTTDERGRYRVPLLQSGEYELDVSLPGFNVVSRRGIRLTVGQTAQIDLTMAVGNVTQEVSVTADANP